MWIVLVIFGPRWNLSVLLQFVGSLVGIGGFGAWIGAHVPRSLQLFAFFILPLCGWLFAHGIRMWIGLKKYQRALDHLGLKTPTGLSPKVVRAIDLENKQRRILVHAVGLDVASFRDKKGALEASVNAIVQEIRVTPNNRQMVEILVSDRELPTLVRFDDRSESLRKPYTFFVGETMDGFIVADLCEIHHMLVAGATGGGKSVFFKQALVGLLKSSKHIQLYLVDLKRGVEFKVFGALNNVIVAKDEPAAMSVLQAVVAEMDRRFRFLEEKGFNEISPERDGLDRIVVAIDEASELFIIDKSSKEAKALATGARDLTDKIAKLGRAAGIHLILATQKVVKETIDTRVQTNINAKMCFRVNTIASSMTVLNNKKAADLPKINGRGIWSVGSSDLVVQVPFLNSEGVLEEVESLSAKFNGDASPLKQPMLQLTAPKNERPNNLIVSNEDSLQGIKRKVAE